VDDKDRHPEFRLPAPGMALPVSFGYLLGLIFVALAVFNLFRVSQIPIIYTIASILWLALVVFVIALNLRFEGGVRQYLVNRLGSYSSAHFVRVVPSTVAGNNSARPFSQNPF
jgi:hypothetical protein